MLLGPSAIQLLAHRAPLWGFRPRLSASMLNFACLAAVKSMLQFHQGAGVGQGNIDGVVLTIDVEKAFDKTTLRAQAQSLARVGFGASRMATLLSELMSSEVWVRLGDVEVGPLAHSRGKQDGCNIPFVFSAVMTSVLEALIVAWRSRG